MEIQHHKEGNHGEFFITENESTIARYTYTMIDDTTMLASHTGVAPQLRGKGIAMRLVKHAAQYARDNGFKIVPSCSYVRWAHETRPELADVIR